MNLGTVLLIIGALVAVAAVLGLLAVSAMSQRNKGQVRHLVQDVLASSGTASEPAKKRPTSSYDVEELKRKSKQELSSKKAKLQMTQVIFRPQTPQEQVRIDSGKLFQAGIFTAEDRRRFEKFQIIAPIVSTILATVGMIALEASTLLLVGAVILGLFIGISIPKSWLDRQIRFRTDETLYFLPLSIEQISIGVSSSLDVWPCIAQIITMSRERNVYTPMTELFMYIDRLISSGLNFQDAVHEVGMASGIPQIRHAFQFLAQCAEHGGEVSKQLQELATAVMTERQVQVEGRIASLPVKATGPLFMVFAGYFVLMLAGIFAQLSSSIQFQ